MVIDEEVCKYLRDESQGTTVVCDPGHVPRANGWTKAVGGPVEKGRLEGQMSSRNVGVT